MTSVILSILIVEDDSYACETLVDLLGSRSPGSVIHSAHNGRAGLETFQLQFPDIVITDIAMAEMNGIAMAARMKELKPETVIIAVTAFTDTTDLLQAIEIGIDHYLVKPLRLEKLFSLVDKVTAYKTEVMERQRFKEALRQSEARHQKELSLLNQQLERRVKERTAELEAAVLELQSFSYTVSHDLRAPLRHINCFSAMLAEDHGDGLPAEAHHYLDRIGEASSRMGSLIDHLLELSRVMRAEITLEPVNLSMLAASVLQMFTETDPSRRVELVIEEGITVHGDNHLLRQLLENLLGNAWKYTSKKATACIEVGRRQAAGQEVIFVKDNGAGFDMNYESTLFKAFQRLHDGEFEGMGIGLATAQRIVQRHGGRIWAQANPGKGATFYFTLPQASDATAAQPLRSDLSICVEQPSLFQQPFEWG